MLKKGFVFSFVFLAALALSGQIASTPELPVASQKVTITFDSSKESRLGYYTGELYAHTGLITKESANAGDWKYVIESWGNNATQPKLTNKGNGIYELEISPDVYTFYQAPLTEKIIQLAFVFRSSDAKKQTNNLYVNIYPEGLATEITQPSNLSVFKINQNIELSAISTETATQKLFAGETLLQENTGTGISATVSFPAGGYQWLIAEASAGGETVRDSVRIFVRNEVVQEPKPAGYRKGINYPAENSAALVLWAPMKDHVFVIGDFNNWELNNDFLMKKDGDYFWLEIPNLEKGKEYVFQYFIDGSIKIADPYTEKISDPWNDKYIPEETYPGLIPYPEGKTEGTASVLHPGQEPYQWEVTDFRVPDKNKLVIYELLVRDFMPEHTYKAVREKLDYLEDLRINVLELMPVNEFEGNNSWGYNPSFYFAPDKYYGPKNELKKLIDECHQRGIAVVIDMVLNHSYGQSPFVQMYMDNWTILPENPWYNRESNFKNPSLQWGFDFNHDSEATRELVDSINSFWMTEYKIDGFRFDFTKGFSNTPYGESSWGSEYDAARIANLKRMTDEIHRRNPDALVIFEHLSDNTEEKELADHGIFLWGNMHGRYTDAGRGLISNSDLSWGLYTSRGWEQPNLVTYAESHDEERIMYTLKQNGLSSGDYNTRNQSTALRRVALNALFHLPLPGPKMLWQFQERGYDQSINRCEDGSVNSSCRLSPKPSYWQYLYNPERLELFGIMAKLNELKQKYEEFTPESFETSLAGAVKWYHLKNGNKHVLAVGNFDIVESNTDITFPATGKWYEFFSRDSMEISSPAQNISLAPGEYRLFSTRMFDDPHVSTDVKEITVQKTDAKLYPNPAKSEINIESQKNISGIKIYSVSGRLIFETGKIDTNQFRLSVENWNPGVYLLRVEQADRTSTLKFIKQ